MLYFIEDKNLIMQQIMTYKHLFYDSISISEIDFTHGIRPLTIKRQPTEWLSTLKQLVSNSR